ncbi:MAG TPA: hypothetical protein VKB86_02665 [Pyrinomonadaceae bacterium]|nr:hypothetical protein [Pyrinomonadaceae bacterium]
MTQKTTNSEAENFREFTKKLLAVPKKEIDKRQEEYKRKKGREKEKRTK